MLRNQDLTNWADQIVSDTFYDLLLNIGHTGWSNL